MLSARRQRQVQVMVKVSGLTCRSVGLVKGENCTGVWRADRGSKLGVGWWGGEGVKWKCSLLELISRESDCSQSARAFQLTADITWETAAAKPPLLWQYPFYRCHCNVWFPCIFFFFPCTLFFWGNFSFKSQIKIRPKILTNPNITRCPDWISNILWYTVFKAIMSIYGHKASFFLSFILSLWATELHA